MNRKLLVLIAILSISSIVNAQTVFTRDIATKRLADRIITLNGSLIDSMHTQSGMMSLNECSELFMTAKTQNIQNIYSNADIFDINKFQAVTPEYDALPQDIMLPNYTYAQFAFFNQTPFLYEYIGRHHFFINPQASVFAYMSNDGDLKLQSALGLQWRGKYKQRLGYHFSAHHYMEQVPRHVFRAIQEIDAFPNAGAYTSSNTVNPRYNYWLFDAQVSYDVVPQHVTATAGYGKFFIGDGIRSLLLSSNAAPVPYLSFRTKFWKLEYSNIFFKATSQSRDYGLQQFGENKYVAIHYLSTNITPWLNIGLFESITSSRKGSMELGYFNPAIFYRAMERNLGSPDKVAIGISAKAIPLSGLQLYGQFFINEFTAKEFFSNNGYLHNKWGAQVGLKYFNVARVSNLDLQLEMNMLRPYAYQHRSNSNYSHYNQFLAHPLGANLKEYIAQVHYRPFTRISLEGILYYRQQGLDMYDSLNFGSNPMKNIKDAPYRHGVYILQGAQLNTLSAQFAISWEWLPYLHVDIGGLVRNELLKEFNTNTKSSYGYLGIRYMMARKDWAQF